jgi:hypothetical protein
MKLKHKKTVSSAVIILALVAFYDLVPALAFAGGGAQALLSCDLKTMNPSGQSTQIDTQQASFADTGVDLALAHGNFSASAYLDNNSFVIDLHDNSTSREAGVQTTSAAVRAAKITSTLKITDAGDWVFVECTLK